MGSDGKRTPIILLPFVLVWSIFSFMIKLTGRLVGAILGLVMMVVGIFLVVTLVAAPVGIPLIIFGLLLMIRSIF